MAEQMTIEKLAQMTQQEFVAVRAEMKEGFATMDARYFALLDRMDAGFATSNAYFEEINKSLDVLKFNIFINRGWPSEGEIEI